MHLCSYEMRAVPEALLSSKAYPLENKDKEKTFFNILYSNDYDIVTSQA